MLFLCYFCRKDGVPSVTEADGSIRSFLERRLDYRLKQTMVIKVSREGSSTEAPALLMYPAHTHHTSICISGGART
jgi:hypothetical protein